MEENTDLSELQHHLLGKTIVQLDDDEMHFDDGSKLSFWAAVFFPTDRGFIFKEKGE